MYHERQAQEGLLGRFANLTPEQNFILNRLCEIDAWTHGKGTTQYIKEAFEGLNGGSFYANTYNRQALMDSIESIHHGKTSNKSFEEIRNALVKRLGVDIDPEYFSIQTLANCECGKSYFADGKLLLEYTQKEMANGNLSIFKHPVCEVKIYTSAEGNMEIKEQSFSSPWDNGEKSLVFVDKKSKKTVLAIEQQNDEIKKVQTEKNPSECLDVEDFRQVISRMKLSEEVKKAFGFDPKKIESFIVSPPKKSELDLLQFFAENSKQNEAAASKHTEATSQRGKRISAPRVG